MNHPHLHTRACRPLLRFLAWTVFTWNISSPAISVRADSLVIPAEYSDVEGPTVMGEGQNFTFRNHYLYYNFEFPTGPIDIVGFRYRPKSFVGPQSVEYGDTQISLTTTRQKSLLREFNANLEAALQPPTIVLNGDLVVETTSEDVLSPKAFDYEFRWETPFRYDPAGGVNLLMDFDSRGGYDQSVYLDAAGNGTFQHEGERLRRHLVEFAGCMNRCYWPGFPITEFIYTPVLPPPAAPGDFNADGVLDARDLDGLTTAVRGGTHPSKFDLNSDQFVNESDRSIWVNDLKRTYLGDANLDGEFNSGDFIDVFQGGQYDDGLVGNSTWSTGDWNGDTEFDSGDFILAFQSGGYEAGPRVAVAVPEPSGHALLFLAALHFVSWIRRNRA